MLSSELEVAVYSRQGNLRIPTLRLKLQVPSHSLVLSHLLFTLP